MKSQKTTGRGGKRSGAGRPKGGGLYNCPTKFLRVPIHLVEDVKAFVLKKLKQERAGA